MVVKKLAVRGMVHAGLKKNQLKYCRKCAACCRSCCKCYCICLSRIPVASMCAGFVLFLGFGLVGYGLYAAMDHLNDWLKMSALDMATLGAAAFGGLLGTILFFDMLIGCCATGRTRFNFCSRWCTRFIGRCIIIWLFGTHYLMWGIGTLLIPVMFIPVVFMGIFFAVCQLSLTKQIGETCIDFREYALDDVVKMTKVCGHEVGAFCKAMSNATPFLACAAVGTIFIVVGSVHILFVLTANYAHIKDHRWRRKPSEWSTCKRCCTLDNPDKYEECWPESEVEEVIPETLDERIDYYNRVNKTDINGYERVRKEGKVSDGEVSDDHDEDRDEEEIQPIRNLDEYPYGWQCVQQEKQEEKEPIIGGKKY